VNAADRHLRLTEAFDSALARPPAERARFLEEAYGSDSEFRAEVERLLEFHEQANDFLDNSPLRFETQTRSPGQLVANRYRIERLVGHGGMGEVYRAHDTLVDQTVALKILRPDLARDPSVARRFQREIRLARRVTHPNVCRLYEAGVDTAPAGPPLHYFTMELLDGETLAQCIRRTYAERGSALTWEEALPIVLQIAAGLGAAHQAGIIHRDLKSANILLAQSDVAPEESLRAVITDFGLARLDQASLDARSRLTSPGSLSFGEHAPGESALAPATITRTAQIAGTVAYMSPEQLTGGEVTQRSDIYSLGIVLYEMATGRLPFDDTHIVQSAVQRTSAPPPDATKLVPRLDRRWATAIERCLQREPGDRLQSAAAVEQLFRRRAQPFPLWSRRTWIKTGAIASIAAAAVSQLPRAFRLLHQDAKLPEGAEALLSPIVNSTGEPRFDGITELFRSQLSQSVHLNLMDRDEVTSTLKQMGQSEQAANPAIIQEVAWRANAALWISGTLQRIGTDYALSIGFETRGSQPNAPQSKQLKSFPATDDGSLMRSVRDASTWIRAQVGESASNIASFDRLPADVTTPSWEALALYARGQQYFMKQDFNSAILEFQGALAKDPKFTLAAMRLGDLLTSQYRQSEGFPQWRRAIQMLDQRSVTRSEELYARAMSSQDTGDNISAERQFRTWQLEYPHDWRPPFYRWVPLALEGHAEEALALLKPIQRDLPDYGDIYAQLINCHLILGQTAAAREWIPELRKYGRPERADLREGYIRFREGDCIGYLEILREIQKSKSYPRGVIDAAIREAMLFVDAGYSEAAAGNAARFLRDHNLAETAPQQNVLRTVQCWAEMLAGKRAGAVVSARQVMEAEKGPVLAAITGSVFARVGERSMAERVLSLCKSLADFPLYSLAQHRIQGEQAKAESRLSEAITQFRLAAALEPKIAHRQYLIEAQPESSEERRELCENIVRIPWQMLRPPPLHCLGSLSLIRNAQGNTNDSFAGRFFASASKLVNH
jgi:eukaryotic-like serine/threonine-protein kinase